MKTRNYLSALALIAAGLMSSCSSNDDAPDSNPNFPQDGVMRFTTSVSDAAASATTRAGLDNDNITGNVLFLWVTPQGESTGSSYIYNGIWLDYGKHSSWTTYDEYVNYEQDKPTTLLWKNKTTPVDIVASNFGVSDGSKAGPTQVESVRISEYQAMELMLIGSDRLYFKGTVNPALTQDKPATDGSNVITEYALVDGKVRLPMSHINSKLTINLILGTEFNTTTDGLGFSTIIPLSEVKVGGTYTMRQFDMTEGIFTNDTPTDLTDITLSAGTPGSGSYQSIGTWNLATSATTNAKATYECILLPQTVAAGTFSVSFMLGGKQYQWTSSAAVTLERGKAHTLNLTVGKDLVILQGSGITTGAWESAGEAEGIETE